ncbi:MAG: HEAT repeat domain-containing protein [Candidatus Wallbacteria bacterium]|nr:HEAT repeat domain-containing protein [Candidatus Wallbacteria bacterium]
MSITDYQKHLTDPDPAIRRKALLTLSRSEHPDKLFILSHVAFNDPDPDIRSIVRKIVDKLDRHRSLEGGTRLSGESGDFMGENPETKIEILKAMFQGRIEASKNIIKQLIMDESDVTVLSTALHTLGPIADSDDLLLIAQFLLHDDARVRANAVESLGNMDHASADEFVRPLIADPDTRVKVNSLIFLFQGNEKEVREHLSVMVAEHSVNALEGAVHAMTRLNFPKDDPLLTEAVSKLDRLRTDDPLQDTLRQL